MIARDDHHTSTPDDAAHFERARCIPEAEHPDADDAMGLDHLTRLGRDDSAALVAEVARLQAGMGGGS